MYDKVIKTMFSEIKKAFDADAIVASLTLIYVCIDTMAYLSMPLEQNKNNKNDFIKWVNTYLKTDPSQPYQYNGDDLYAARCGQLHIFSSFSEYGEKNNCKKFGYHIGSEHIFNVEVHETHVLISVKRLIFDFFSAVEAFFLEAKNDFNLRKCMDSRIHQLYQHFLIDKLQQQ